VRKITKRHIICANEIGMEPENFTEELEDALIEIRKNFAASENQILRKMAVADDDTLDDFLHEALKR
jgi:hypothetical protein